MYVCLDNEVYANTGGQRSSSTPIGSSTTTAPAGSHSYGEKDRKKKRYRIYHGSAWCSLYLLKLLQINGKIWLLNSKRI